MHLKIINYILLITFGLIILWFTFFIWTNSYQDFTYKIINYYGRVEQLERFKSEYLTKSTFLLIKFLFLSVSVLWFGLFAFFHYKYNKIAFYINQSFSALIQEGKTFLNVFRKLTNIETYILVSWFIVFFISRVYFVLKFPLHIDEAFSYVFIVQKGFGVTLSYYPGPNNHIAYLLLCDFTQLFVQDPIWIMRLPVLIISLVSVIFIFLTGKKYFGFNTTLLALSIFSFSEYGIFYSTHGRGYFLMFLCVCLVLVSMERYYTISMKNKSFSTVIRSKSASIYLVLFIFSSVIGFYTIPVFIYPFLSVLLIACLFFLIEKNVGDLKRLTYSIFIIIILTTFCYLPILIVSGLNAIIGNSWVQSMSFKDFILQFPDYFISIHGTFYTIEGFGVVFTFLFLIICTYYIFSKDIKNKKETVGLLTIFLFPLLIILFQRVLPFARIWFYKSFFEILGLSIGIVYLLNIILKSEKLKLGIVLLICCFQSIFLIIYWNNNINDEGNIYNHFPKLIEKLEDKKVKKVFVNEDVYNVFIRYNSVKSGKKIKVIVEKPGNATEIDHLVLDRNKDFPKEFKSSDFNEFYRDGFVIAYEKK